MRNWAIISRGRLTSRLAFALVGSAVFLGTQIMSALPAQAAQTIPYKVNFQGRLTDQSGNILANGTYNIKFRLFDALTVGVNKWEEDRVFSGVDNRVTVTNGLFNVQFGDVTGLAPALFSGIYPLYLEVELPTPATATCASNGCASFTEGAMVPRQPLASSPYAFNSDTLDGLDSTSFAQLATANTYTATNLFTPGASAVVGLTVKASTGGAANALEVFDSANLRQAFFNAAGSLNVGQVIQPTTNNAVDLGLAGTAFRSLFVAGIDTGSVSTALVIGASNAASITIGKVGVAASVPGGLTTSTGTISGNLFSGSGASLTNLNPTNLVQGSGAVTLLSANATSLTVNSGTTGALNLATQGSAKIIQIGQTTAAVTDTIGIGNSSFAGSVDNLTIGNQLTTSNTAIQGGTGANAITLAPGANGSVLASTTGTGTIEFNSVSSIIVQSTVNSATAFQVQNAVGAPVFLVDTTTNNLVTNPGFEVNTAGWAGVTATLTQNKTKGQHYHGQASLSVNVTTAAGGAQAQTFNTAVTPGSYVFSFYAMNSTAGALGVNIAGGSAPVCVLNATAMVTTGFQPYTCSFTSTTTNITAITITSTTTGLFYLDAVQLVTSANNINAYGNGNIQLRGIVNAPVVFQNTSNSTTEFQVQSVGGSNLFTVDSLNKNVEIGLAATDATQVLLQLDSFSTFADTAACSTTTNQGALYYNTSSNAIRSCVSGAWEDVVTTAGLGIMVFGIVPDSGISPGDLASLQTAGATGPCKVSATSGTVIAWTACTAFSGGRKVIVAAGTISPPVTAGFDHVCLNPSGVVTVTNGAAETTNLSAVSWNAASIGNSYVCLADLKVSGAAITAVYDTRAFTTSQKEFVTTTAGIQNGVIVIPSGTGVALPGVVTSAQTVRGVVVASNGGTASGGIPNAIIVVSGPTAVKATAGTAATVVTQGTTTNGYAVTGGAATLTYSQLGVSRKAFPATACTTTANAANCDMSLFFNMNLR